MRYMLVNVSEGNLPIDLHHPDVSYQRAKMRRLGPDVAVSIPRGESIDILPHFKGSIERAHAAIKHSRDILKLLNPNQLHIYVCDDAGNRIDVDKLLSCEGSEKPVDVTHKDDTTRPDIELAQTLASQDQFEANKRGEANTPKTYIRYKVEDLEKLTKNQIVKLAKKEMNLTIDTRLSKGDMIKIVIGSY